MVRRTRTAVPVLDDCGLQSEYSTGSGTNNNGGGYCHAGGRKDFF